MRVATDGREVLGVYRCYKGDFCTSGSAAHCYSGRYGDCTCGTTEHRRGMGLTRAVDRQGTSRGSVSRVLIGRCLAVRRITVLLKLDERAVCGVICDNGLQTSGVASHLSLVEGQSVSCLISDLPCAAGGDISGRSIRTGQRLPIPRCCSTGRVTRIRGACRATVCRVIGGIGVSEVSVRKEMC